MRDIPDEDPSRPYIVQNILVTRETLDAAQENLRGAAIEAFGRSNIGHVGFRMYPNINDNNVTQAVVGFTKPADEIRRRQFMRHWVLAGRNEASGHETTSNVEIAFDFPEPAKEAA